MKSKLIQNSVIVAVFAAMSSTSALLWAEEEALPDKVFKDEHLSRYVPDPDPVVRERIEQWRDLKFGLLMHWGTYSQLGIVESWSICPEKWGWCVPTNVEDYFEYKTMYENLPLTFNPTLFNPQKWAKAAKDAGMKYVVFTTKHHDGFCMFDSEYTDYKITDESCPFSKDPRADVTGEIFNAFREEGLWLGAYFSKPDWHHEDFWWSRFPPKDRNPNYDVTEHPEKWEGFVQYTHNQVMELCENYGKLDILWFDGGWVKKVEYEENKLGEIPAGYQLIPEPNLDIRMGELVKKVRSVQPEMIVVDRAVAGEHQNYLTPENQVPHEMLSYPWESCIILGGGWSYSHSPEFKSSRELIHLLADIVSKGGSLLLNIGPSPAGTWYEEAYQRLEDIGEWMEFNSEAIYETRVLAPYFKENLRYTKGEDGSVYAIYLLDEGEALLPKKIVLQGLQLEGAYEVTLLGAPEATVSLDLNREAPVLTLSKETRKAFPSIYAITFKISTK